MTTKNRMKLCYTTHISEMYNRHVRRLAAESNRIPDNRKLLLNSIGKDIELNIFCQRKKVRAIC